MLASFCVQPAVADTAPQPECAHPIPLKDEAAAMKEMHDLAYMVMVFHDEAKPAPLNPKVKRTILTLTNIFEHSTPELNYCNVENDHDDRGWTAGFDGFTTANEEPTWIVTRYAALQPSSAIAKLLPILKKNAQTGSANIKNLSGFPAAWKAACKDPAFNQLQLDAADHFFLEPAFAIAKEIGLNNALSLGQLYDTAVLQGAGSGPDELYDIVKDTKKYFNGRSPLSPGQPIIMENQWMERFMKIRIEHMNNPHDRSTRAVFRAAVDRVHVYEKFLKAEDTALDTLLKFKVFGDYFIVP